MENILEKVKALEVTTNRLVTNSFSGAYRSNFHGGGIEVEGLREYDEGDNARHIDWVSTAKLGTPFVKKYRESRELPTFIIIDTSLSMQFGTTDRTKQDIAIEAAAILLFSAVKNSETVGAIIYADTIQSYIPPRKGKKHALRILREILSAYAQNKKAKPSNTADALRHFNTMIKKHPICFLISDLDVVTDDVLQALAITHLKNDFVYLHVNDPFETEIPDNETGNLVLRDTNGMEGQEFSLGNHKLQKQYHLLRHKKEVMRKEHFAKKGIDMLTLSTSDNTFVALSRFFERRKKMHAVRY